MAGRRLALIVATDEYLDPGLGKLRSPATDADALAKVLADPELGEFEVDVLRNETNSAIAEHVETLLSGGKPDDLIVMHFSCHGLKDDSGELYLAARNTRPALLASTAVDAALVNRLMRRSRAQRVVLFLDCCYGGAFERGMLPRAAGVVDVADQFQQREAELSSGRGRVVITASNAMEFAFEGTDLADTIEQKPSIFTGALVEGLTTGEADRDQDGMVSLGELYDYVFERVRRESPNQTPGKWEFGLQGDLILAKNPQRVVVPAPVPAELLELIGHPFPATRLGSVEALSRMAEGTNLPVAAGAREVIGRMLTDDSRSVAEAAAQALAATSLQLSATDVDLGSVEVGAPASSQVTIVGVPLAAASKVESSTPALRARRLDRTIRFDADTTTPGPIDVEVTVTGPAGTASIRVHGMVTGSSLDQRNEAARPAIERAVPKPERIEPEQLPEVVSPPVQAAKDEDQQAPTKEVIKREPRIAPLNWASASRAATRGLLGAVISDVLTTVGYFLAHLDQMAPFLAKYVTDNAKILALDAVAFTLVVVAVEWLLPVLRVPDGAVFGPLRGRHVSTAALQGALVGVTIGAFDLNFVVAGQWTDSAVIVWLLVGGAIGFAAAEAILVRRERGRPA